MLLLRYLPQIEMTCLYIYCVLKMKTNADRGNLRPTAKVKTRGPWIPPGKASIREASYKWEVKHRLEEKKREKKHSVYWKSVCLFFLTKGPTHCLEITPPLTEPEPECCQPALQLADLTSQEEEDLQGRISQYEQKIDSLHSEISCLKNEVWIFSASCVVSTKTVELYWTMQCSWFAYWFVNLFI